jgi:hypothetical protein
MIVQILDLRSKVQLLGNQRLLQLPTAGKLPSLHPTVSDPNCDGTDTNTAPVLKSPSPTSMKIPSSKPTRSVGGASSIASSAESVTTAQSQTTASTNAVISTAINDPSRARSSVIVQFKVGAAAISGKLPADGAKRSIRQSVSLSMSLPLTPLVGSQNNGVADTSNKVRSSKEISTGFDEDTSRITSRATSRDTSRDSRDTSRNTSRATSRATDRANSSRIAQTPPGFAGSELRTSAFMSFPNLKTVAGDTDRDVPRLRPPSLSNRRPDIASRLNLAKEEAKMEVKLNSLETVLRFEPVNADGKSRLRQVNEVLECGETILHSVRLQQQKLSKPTLQKQLSARNNLAVSSIINSHSLSTQSNLDSGACRVDEDGLNISEGLANSMMNEIRKFRHNLVDNRIVTDASSPRRSPGQSPTQTRRQASPARSPTHSKGSTGQNQYPDSERSINSMLCMPHNKSKAKAGQISIVWSLEPPVSDFVADPTAVFGIGLALIGENCSVPRLDVRAEACFCANNS